VVNFNYVSSPKFVQSRKVLLMSAACLSNFYKFLKLSNKQHMGSFYAPTCKTDCLQILYKFRKNWISVPNIVHQLTLSLRCKYCKIHRRSNFQGAINSTRRSAAERLQANDVSILWCHSSRVRSRTLEHAYRRPFLTVLREFEPQKCCRPSCGRQKALPYVTMRVLNHRAWNSMNGLLQ